MTDTKPLEIKGTIYNIKRFDLEESSIVDDAIKANPDVLNQKLVTIFYGTIKEDGSRLFESMDVIKKLDHETGLRLWVEINSFNEIDRDFLLRLKNLPSQVVPVEKM